MAHILDKEAIIGAISGLAAGYILWLVAISVGEDFTTVNKWSLLVLAGSVALAVGAGVWGWWQRRRGKYPWAMFAFGLPILPLIMTLAVLADIADFWV
jgi:uncharacterized iron-regulated membrane protein